MSGPDPSIEHAGVKSAGAPTGHRQMSTLRIGLVSPHSWPEVTRGGERYLHDLAWYLSGRGHRVEVLSGTDGPRYEETVDGARFVRLHHRLPARLAARGTTKWDTFGAIAAPALLRRRYDVVQALAATSAVAARVAGQRTIFTAMGHPTEDQFGWRPLDRRLFQAALIAAHITVAPSEPSARQIRLLFGRPALALSPGVRTADFPANLAPRDGPPRLLFSGDAAVRRKGLDHLLRAMPAVLERFPDTRLELLGGGEHEWAFEALGDDFGRVERAVDVLGRQSGDVSRYYREATVTVLPAKQEAFGLVLVESLASGTPVVCSDDGGMPDIVSTAEVGRRAPFGAPPQLAAALIEAIELARDRDTPARCTEHARRWDWQDAVGPAHEALYARLMAERRRLPGLLSSPRWDGVRTRTSVGTRSSGPGTP